jgi:AcrR family transcriptional regulator
MSGKEQIKPPKKEAKPTKGALARAAILAATKELVALKGPHATTVRDVTEATGANVASVRYYFGSKEDLIRAAAEDITGAVNDARLDQLRAAETAAAGRAIPPEAILRALIEPIKTVSRANDGGSLYLRMIYQMRITPQDPLAMSNFHKHDHVAQAFLRAMATTFPALDREQLIWRYEFARGAAIHLLSDVDPKVQRIQLLAGDTPVQTTLSDQVIDTVIGLIMGGFTRP